MAGPERPPAASPSSIVFGRSLPPRGSWRHPPGWPPPRLPWVFFSGPPAPSSRWRRRSEDPGPAGGGERSGFAAGARILHFASQRSDPRPTSRQIRILFRVPRSHPVSPDGKWSPRLEAGGAGDALLFCFVYDFFFLVFFCVFFFFFLFFLNRRFISVQPRAPRAVRDSATTRPPRSFLGGETGGSHNSPRR